MADNEDLHKQNAVLLRKMREIDLVDGRSKSALLSMLEERADEMQTWLQNRGAQLSRERREKEGLIE